MSIKQSDQGLLKPPAVLLILFGVCVGMGTFIFATLSRLLLHILNIQDIVQVQQSMAEHIKWDTIIISTCLLICTAVYDFRLIGHWTADGAFMSIFFSWTLASSFTLGGHWEEDGPHTSLFSSWTIGYSLFGFYIVGWLCGMASAGFERFSIGWILHAIPSVDYQKAHEAFHERLRQRKLKKEYSRSDDWHEISGFITLFFIRSLVLYAFHAFHVTLHPVWIKGYWMGLSTEQYFGQLLRVYLQFIPYDYIKDKYSKASTCASSWKCQAERVRLRFLSNCHQYYWYHLLVNENQCSGFSAPLWDDLCLRNPLKRQGWNRYLFWTWSWFPWIDFILSDYSKDVALSNDLAWENYIKKHE